MSKAVVDNALSQDDVTFGKLVKSVPWALMAVISAVSFAYIYWSAFSWLKNSVYGLPESYYGHMPIVPVASAGAIALNWRNLQNLKVKPNLWGFALLVVAAMMEIVGKTRGMYSIVSLTIPIVLFGASLVMFGVAVSRILAFPILFLYFMIPPPLSIVDKLAFAIQLLSTIIGTALVKLVGIDALRDGMNISAPNYSVRVEAPCSGFQGSIALIMVATAILYLTEGKFWRRVVLFLAALPAGLVTNSVRIALIVMLGEWFGEGAADFMHKYAAHLVLIASMVLLVLLAKWLKCWKIRESLSW